MVSITPDRMPYVRRETLEWMREHGDVFYSEQYKLSSSAAIAIVGNSLSSGSLLKLECERLVRGSMYYVDNDMCELIRHAAPEMPEFAPSPFDLPSPFGFLWWQSPVIDRPRPDMTTLIYILERICMLEDVKNTTMRPVTQLVAMLMARYDMTKDEAIKECSIIAQQAGCPNRERIQTRCSMEELASVEAIEILSYIGGEPTPVQAVTWGPYGVDENGNNNQGTQRIDGVVASAVWLSFWTEPVFTDKFWPSMRKKPPILVENEILYPWYMRNDDSDLLVSKSMDSVYSWFHALLATIVLSKQENLAASTQQRADRAERKRTARTISSHASDSVLVTRLRPSNSASGHRSGDRMIGKDHRFVVSGHWREVWHGSHTDPARPRVQRPQWILPFVKGADGAPLVMRDRVVKM